MDGITNIYFPISALMITSLIVIMFFRNRRVQNIETKVYKFLVLANLVEVILACTIIIFAIVNGSLFILTILDKLDYIFILTWVWLLFCYVYLLCFQKKKVIAVTCIFNIVIYTMMCFAGIKIVNENGIMNSYGLSNNILFIAILAYLLLIIYCVICGIKKKIEKKKYIPIAVLIFLIVLMMIVRIIKPELVLLSSTGGR